MARKNRYDVKKDEGFGLRFKEAFDGKPNTEIARELGISDSTVTLYIKGRIPSAATLIEISNLTSCNIHWLLTGEGEKKFTSSKPKAQTLVFLGGKGGVGTSSAAMLTAVVLADRGYRTLLISNRENLVPFLFSLSKTLKLESLPRKTKIADSDKYIKTEIENLEIFTGEGDEFVETSEICAESAKKSSEQIINEYNFIIFDIHAFGEELNNSYLYLKSLLSKGKLIIPYEVGNSMTLTVDKILGSAPIGSLLFSLSFLGVFINKNVKARSNGKFYKTKINEIRNIIGEKMFDSVVGYSEKDLADFILLSDLKKLKKTELFKDFSNLVDEIIKRLKTGG